MTKGPKKRELSERIRDMVLVDEVTGCWNWQYATNQKGYGVIRVSPRNMMAHRASYLAFVGQIPDGAEIDHICKNRACVNPDHLRALSVGENRRLSEAGSVNAARQKAKTHCPKGHPYSGENLYVFPSGARHCKICRRESQRRARLRRKTAARSQV